MGLLDNKEALISGLLGFGGGLLSNSSGHYGQFGPAFGAGVQGFNKNYFGELQQGKDNAFKKRQLDMMEKLQGSQIAENEAQAKKRQFDMEQALRQQQAAEAIFARLSGQQPQQAPQPQLGASQPQVFPPAVAGAESDLLGGPRVPSEYQDLQAPQVNVDAKAIPTDQNPIELRRFAAQLAGAGNLQGAQILLSLADKAEAQLNREDDKKNKTWTDAQGITRYLHNGQPVANQKPKAPEGMQYDDEGRLIEIPGYVGMKSKIAAAGKPTVSVDVKNTLSTEKKYGEQFAGKIAEADSSMRDAALKAPDLANRANGMLEILESGKVITGTGAEYRLALGKAMGLVGLSDKETIANTEAMMVDMGKNTLDQIKTSGLGSGNGFSNADRDFLEKVAGGKISLEADTIKRVATLSHRAAVESAKKWSDRVKMIPKSALEGTGITADPIEVPALYEKSGANRVRKYNPATGKIE